MVKVEDWSEQHFKELSRRTSNFDKKEWQVVLKNAPVECLFYALMHKIMRAMDTIKKYESVKADIDKAYADDEFVDNWL